MTVLHRELSPFSDERSLRSVADVSEEHVKTGLVLRRARRRAATGLWQTVDGASLGADGADRDATWNAVANTPASRPRAVDEAVAMARLGQQLPPATWSVTNAAGRSRPSGPRVPP